MKSRQVAAPAVSSEASRRGARHEIRGWDYGLLSEDHCAGKTHACSQDKHPGPSAQEEQVRMVTNPNQSPKATTRRSGHQQAGEAFRTLRMTTLSAAAQPRGGHSLFTSCRHGHGHETNHLPAPRRKLRLSGGPDSSGITGPRPQAWLRAGRGGAERWRSCRVRHRCLL